MARHSSHTFMKLFTEFNMLRDHGVLGIVVQREGESVPGGGKLDRNVAVLDLLNIVFNDIQVGVISKRSLDERCMLLVLRVCDDFFHYIDLSVSLGIEVIMRRQFVKEYEDKPSTVAALRLTRLLFSTSLAAGS